MKDFVKIPKKRINLLRKNSKQFENAEELSKTKIMIEEEDIAIEGDSFDVYKTKSVIKAFGRGFDLKEALNLLDDDYGLEIINLPDLINSEKRMIVVKGRIIGNEGKTKKLIEEYTDTKIAVQGKTVSILGRWDKINLSKEAVLKLINGASHQALYRWLERNSVL